MTGIQRLTEQYGVQLHLTGDAEVEAGQSQQVDAREKQTSASRREYIVS